MDNRARNLAWVAMAAAAIVTASPANAEPARRIVVRVCYGDNPTPFQLAVVERAQQDVSAIYSAVGISLVWSTGAEPADGHAMQLTVQVLSGARTERLMRINPDLKKSVLGVAPLDSGRVYVFWDRIIPRARKEAVPAERVLGRVLAHEIGHHLLPAKGHSTTGLMRPSLDYRSSELPAFTDAQIESIQTVLVAAS